MDRLHQILEKYWGYPSFRPLQQEIIVQILDKKDLLAFLPTGSGKSLCFQLSAICSPGLTLVITPLIALMKDQMAQLQKRSIQAEAIFSGMSHQEIDQALDRCRLPSTKLLYVSPERLQTELFKVRAPHLSIATLVVDEAHCISQWGYDFRPSYLAIADFRSMVPRANVVAFTGTATKRVKGDIASRLGLHAPLIFSQTLYRPNLVYWVCKTTDKQTHLFKALRQSKGSTIIYVHTRKQTEKIAELLNNQGIGATFYHAGLTLAQRMGGQKRWYENEIRVMVATCAFGMGIDKPDVSLVIHWNLPPSLEAYCQETGRAGRNGQTAHTILLYEMADLSNLKQRLAESYPTVEQIKKLYQALANYYKMAVGSHAFVTYDFDLQQFAQAASMPHRSTYYGLKLLEAEGFIQLHEAYYQPAKLQLLGNKTSWYKFQIIHPEYDLLLKGLLRLYGGQLFAHHCVISEKEVAQLVQCSLEKVYNQLHTLNQMKLLLYLPQKSQPQITFLTSRHVAAQLPLDIEKIKQKNQAAHRQVEDVLHYISHERQCRLATLLEYFDEKPLVCDTCDICYKKKKAQKVEQYILEGVKTGKKRLKVLMQAVPMAQEEEVLAEIRKMLEVGKLQYVSLDELALVPSE